MSDWDKANLIGKAGIICQIAWPTIKDLTLVWVFVMVNRIYDKLKHNS
jgi:hypothetical protein